MKRRGNSLDRESLTMDRGYASLSRECDTMSSGDRSSDSGCDASHGGDLAMDRESLTVDRGCASLSRECDTMSRGGRSLNRGCDASHSGGSAMDRGHLSMEDKIRVPGGGNISPEDLVHGKPENRQFCMCTHRGQIGVGAAFGKERKHSCQNPGRNNRVGRSRRVTSQSA